MDCVTLIENHLSLASNLPNPPPTSSQKKTSQSSTKNNSPLQYSPQQMRKYSKNIPSGSAEEEEGNNNNVGGGGGLEKSSSTSSISSSSNVGKGRTQALKDLKLTIEYKHLKMNAPSGVLVTPSYDDLRTWYGVIFIRKGYYQGGIFKFIVKLPLEYNDHGIYPHIGFYNDVFNPFVHRKKTIINVKTKNNDTQNHHDQNEEEDDQEDDQFYELDLKAQYPAWNSTSHFMVTALTFMKKIFYLKDEDLINQNKTTKKNDDDDDCANPEAKQMFLENKEEFAHRASMISTMSQDKVYDHQEISPIQFTTPKVEHEKLRESILEAASSKGGEGGTGGSDQVIRSSSLVIDLLLKAKNNQEN
mmetsp:Transcript_5235/g.6813  ORF Transcript_5235/g.6813 Transcript_5235/m.6813 type:complete len:359 (+) Transcript_5235:488-1564(+)